MIKRVKSLTPVQMVKLLEGGNAALTMENRVLNEYCHDAAVYMGKLMRENRKLNKALMKLRGKL